MFKHVKKLTAILLVMLLALSSMTTVLAKGDEGEPIEAGTEVEKLEPKSSASKNAIAASPEPAVVKAGETAVFTVTATGKVRSYQWQVSKNGGKTWSKANSKTDTLKVAAKEELNGYQYRCKVTFKDSSVKYSEPAKLTVKKGALATEGSFKFETDDYLVTVYYDAEAGIPEGTELFVSPIAYGSEAYWSYREQALAKLNENATWGDENVPDTRKGIADAAFFDISLMSDGQEFEPEVPLQVEITLKNGGLLQIKGEETKVVHFGKNGTELINNVSLKSLSAPEGLPEGVLTNEFTYLQDGFSVIGVFTTDEFIDFETAVPYERVILVPNTVRKVDLRAGETGIAANKTVTDTDDDGIYELALTVTGASEQSQSTEVNKSNVILVIDTSQSMVASGNRVYSEYTYSADTYNANNQYYYRNGNNYARAYYRNGNWYTSQNNGSMINSQIYLYETRLAATQRAAKALIDALLENNVEGDPELADVIEISIVEFARLDDSGIRIQNVNTEAEQTQANSVIDGFSNSASSHYGTNWEEGLRLAKNEADRYKTAQPDEGVSVIFLTDGMPTYYLNANGTQAGNGQEGNATNVHNSWNGAAPRARAIVANSNGTPTGYSFYSIFSFGGTDGANYLNALTHYANTGSGSYNYSGATESNFYNAQNTAALEEAFSAIVNHINNNMGYAGVNITDGVSLGATNTSVAVGGNINSDSMRYSVLDGAVTLYKVKFSNGTATFTIYNGEEPTVLTDSTPETVTTQIGEDTITSTVYSVTVGSGDSAKTYKMSPATIDENGLVKWDLAGLGILDNGITYKLAFDVWPNQIAYDIAADLNNGIYDNVDEALEAYGVTDEDEAERVRNALQQNASGAYEVYTNYSQSVEYYEAESHTDDEGNTTWIYGAPQSKDLPKPDPMPLQGSLLPLQKAWESGLSQTELDELLWNKDGTSRKYNITLYVWKADTEEALNAMINNPISETNKPYITEVLGWDETAQDYIFERDVAVAPGMMVNLDEAEELGFDITDTSKIRTFTNGDTTKQYYVVELGHYYYVTESGSDLHFELETVLYHPMVVDGTLYNIFFGSNGTVTRMDPMYAVVATNYLKGGLNIRKEVSSTQIPAEYTKTEVKTYQNGKVVLDEEDQPVMREVDDIIYTPVEDCEDEFAFKITIWRVDDEGNILPVYTYDDQFDASYKAISGSIGYREFGLGDDGEFVTLGRNVIVFEDTPNAAEKIAANQRGDNEPVYATHTNDGKTQIILRMPANGEIRLVNLPSGTYYTVEEVVDEAGSYNFAATKSELKYDDENVEYIAVGTTNGVSGKVVGNTANLETFYNWAAAFYVYHSSDNTVEKISFTDERVEGTFNTETGKYEYTFNIVNETAENYLYGGYYKAFGGSTMTTAEIVAAEFTADSNKKLWYTDVKEGVAPYDAKKANVWKKANAYTDTVTATGGGMGKEMTPVSGIVYYLKEVPTGYIRPYIHFTYDERDPGLPLKRLYVITAADDANYDLVGYAMVDPETGKEKITSSSKGLTVTIKKPDGTVDATLTAKSVFNGKKYTYSDGTTVTLEVTRGYLYMTDLTSSIGTEFTYTPCWNTLDKVLVKGLTVRTVNGGTNFLENDANCIGVTDEAAP